MNGSLIFRLPDFHVLNLMLTLFLTPNKNDDLKGFNLTVGIKLQ